MADVNQLAARIVAAAVSESAPGNGKDPEAVRLGRIGGLRGGPARAARLSAARRSEIARTAARARWGAPPDAAGRPAAPPVRIVRLRDGVIIRVTRAPGTAAGETTEEITLLDSEWSALARIAAGDAVAAECERVATLMLERVTDLAATEGYDGFYVWQRLAEAALYYAQGKAASGRPLTAAEHEMISDDIAEAEDRLFYRAAPDGRVEKIVVPREAS